MVQAGPPYAHGNWEWKGWENHEKTIPGPSTSGREGALWTPSPCFSSRNQLSATRALHAVWGFKCIQWGSRYRQQRSHLPFKSWREDIISVRDEIYICLALTAQGRERATAVFPISWVPVCPSRSKFAFLCPLGQPSNLASLGSSNGRYPLESQGAGETHTHTCPLFPSCQPRVASLPEVTGQ